MFSFDHSSISGKSENGFSFTVDIQIQYCISSPNQSVNHSISNEKSFNIEGGLESENDFINNGTKQMCEEKFEKVKINVGPTGLICFSQAAAVGNNPINNQFSSWIPALRDDIFAEKKKGPIEGAELSSNLSVSSFIENLNIIEDCVMKQGDATFGETNYSSETNRVVKLQIRQVDEIHVIPCQCAFTVMGMKDFHSELAKSASNRALNLTPKRPPRLNKGNFSSPNTMSRTVSGQTYFSKDAMSTQTPFSNDGKGLSISTSNNRAKPAPSLNKKGISGFSGLLLFMNSPTSNCFVSLGYHEIVLISNPQCSGCIATEEESRSWSTVNIRCSDHEQMDELIGVLKAASNASIIPFSQNPKARLETMQSAYNLEKCRFQFLSRDDANLSPISNTGETSAPTKTYLQKPHANQLIQQGSMGSTGSSPKLRKDNRKELWSNADCCEYCSIDFTLLVRRHHCRKCDKSCCEDCSRFVIVQGGEETRLCNRCNFSVALERNPHGRHRRTDSKATLGKVNPFCSELGVGTMGALPHWQSYLTFDPEKRPAVGRITVEVIEALALQRMDFKLKSNPYVRATVTGYDYDLEWNLQEWLPERRFSLTTSYCSSTLSPVWRGPGKLGGELLTLPVISSSGCILRLEVFHLDALGNTNAEAHPLIGIVEIPLSDITNANLRVPDSWNGFTDAYDGFVERWYHLERPRKSGETSCVLLARPVDNPLPSGTSDENTNQSRNAMTKFVHSIDEIGQIAEKLCRAPVEWIGTALGIEVPRVSKNDRRAKSLIHVRIKLNLSEAGDFLSHSWFPPVSERPKRPSFEPDITYSRIVYIIRVAAPYLNMFKFCEKCIEWKRPPMTCIYFYCGVIFHIIFFERLWVLFHLYLIIFMTIRLQRMRRINKRVTSKVTFADTETEIFVQDQEAPDEFESNSDCLIENEGDSQQGKISENPEEKVADRVSCQPSPSLTDLKNNPEREGSAVKDEEAARLNKAIVWIAKKILSSRGMDAFQFKLGKISKDVTRLNSLWDGTSIARSYVAYVMVFVSFALHCVLNIKWLWIAIITVAYFGPSPILQKFVRWNFGLSRGFAKVIRRRHLHLLEEEKYGKWSQ